VAGAVAAAASVTCCCPPGFRLNAAGEAATPVGSPLTTTLTLAVKVLTAATLTLTVRLWPFSRVRLVGKVEIAKSPADCPVVPPPPPRPAMTMGRKPRAAKHSPRVQTLRNRMMAKGAPYQRRRLCNCKEWLQPIVKDFRIGTW